MIGEHMLILDWRNSKYFVGQLSEMKFLCHVLYSRKFIRIIKN